MPQQEEISRELERLLASPAFKGSRRSSDFLRFVVDASLAGHPESIKERTIGVEVFGKPADYDTSEDAIVRVKANEVRKRLAQAYQEMGDGTVHIVMPAGSYVPEFRPVTNPVMDQTQPLAVRPALRMAGMALLICAAMAAAWLMLRPGPAFDRFWRPFLDADTPPILCVAHPTVFTMTQEVRDDESPTVERADLNRDSEHYVGVGDAQAMARLAGLLAARGHAAQIRSGDDTSFTDLRHAPAILIGAFTNQWTMELGHDLRFVFERETGGRMWVQDQQPPRQRFEYQRTTPPMDFVILSRVFDSRSGRPVIMAAGLAHFGTQVAGEFLTTPAWFNEAMRNAPEGWEKKNLQIVLRAEVIGKSPGPPRVVAMHFW